MGKGALGDHPRHCICKNASRGLSATAEFLVKRLRAMLSEKKEKWRERVVQKVRERTVLLLM